MATIIDHIILFSSCSIILFIETNMTYGIIAFLVVLSISALNEAFSDTYIEKMLCMLYPVLCLFQPVFCIFIPVILYDTMERKNYVGNGLNIIMLLWFISNAGSIYVLLLPFLVGVSYLLMKKTKENVKLHEEYKLLRDTSKEFSILLENKNKDLMEKQDYEIHLATLNERNRIAREIHDNVGHLLSRSIIMVGAILAVSKDDELNDSIKGLKSTLSSAMDNIRQSVHDLHEESIDLDAEVKRIIGEFQYCNVTYEYDMEQGASRALKYSFITIIKEALSNVMKHSEATHVKIVLTEHPGLYQLLIQDNGTKKYRRESRGIGLENMKERVASLNGTILFTNEKGFQIFISVPKQNQAMANL